MSQSAKISTFLPVILPNFFWFNTFLISGILCATEFKFYGFILLGLSTICYYLNSCIHKQQSFLLAISSVLIFFLLGVFAIKKNQKTHPFASIPRKNIIITAKITDKLYRDTPEWRYRYTAQVSQISTSSSLDSSNTSHDCAHHVPCNLTIHMYTNKRIFAWIDDTILCGPLTINFATNTLDTSQSNANSNTSKKHNSFNCYLQKERIDGTVFLHKLAYQKLTRSPYSWRDFFYWKREALLIHLRKKMSPDTYAFFCSLFMGNKISVKSKLDHHKNSFKLWGISHHLARSGLHLVVFIIIWHFLLNLLPLPFFIKHLLAGLLVLVYGILSWPSISFWRAFFSYFFYKICVFFNFPLHPIHAISFVCFMILLANPHELFFLDFQLSFLLTFCLAWIAQLNQQRMILYSFKKTKNIAANKQVLID